MANDFTGATINTTEEAIMFNRLVQRNAILAVRKNNGLFYVMAGKLERGQTPAGLPKFERLNMVSGLKLEQTLTFDLPTISGLPDANAMDAVTLSINANENGAAEWDYCNFSYDKAIPDYLYHRARGSEAKLDNFIAQQADICVKALEKKIGADLSAGTAPARTAFGGWHYAISDGTNVGGLDESAYTSYGGITRTTTTNTDWIGTIYKSTGVFTTTKFASLVDQCDENGGVIDTAVASRTVYGIARAAFLGSAIIENDADMAQFGGRHFTALNVRFILDKNVGTDANSQGMLGLLDSSTWRLSLDERGFKTTFLTPEEALWWKGSGQMRIHTWGNCVCLDVNKNGKMTGITG